MPLHHRLSYQLTDALLRLKLFTLPFSFNSPFMKRYILLILLVFTFQPLSAQVIKHVKIAHSLKVISGTEVELQVTATIDKGWNICSLEKKEGSLFLPTELNVPKSKNYTLVGGVNQPKPIEKYHINLEGTVEFHEGTVTFTQRIKVLNTSYFKLVGEFVYQTWNDEVCLAPEHIDLEFDIKIPTKANAITP